MDKQNAFILKAKEKHGGFFDFSKFQYFNANIKSTVICIKHSHQFEQSPASILRGSNGCKLCRSGTLEEFIDAANSIHNYSYDYSLFKFKNQTTKGTIICSKHGAFQQEPIKHIKEKRGCKGCSADNQRKDLPTFIKQAQKIHKEFYSYEKAIYIGARKKLIITCPNHGVFSCSPDNHLRGKGCPKCTTKTKSKFIEDARAIHGDKYDYSNVKYEGTLIKVTVKCPIHGNFRVIPSSHINADVGCTLCSKRYQYSTNEWVAAAIKRHGNKYDYSEAIYTGAKNKITIICPEHGKFSSVATSHLTKGSGCKKCGDISSGKASGEARRKSTKKFIEESKKLHNESNYDYSKTVYARANEKLTITCRIHGDFYKSPTKHIHGLQGCPVCSNLRGYNKNEEGCLYILESSCGLLVKIGISNNLVQRTNDLRTNQKLSDFNIIKSYWHDDGAVALELERKAHNLGDKLNLRGIKQSELFNIFKDKFDGYTEWFKKDKRLLYFIEKEFKEYQDK
ncbi:GIY-YIG nuclease family protein [Pseudoalteromonas denitrificans]|uniref:T5orf172 domain-containing protein n=1 Tax=Pseudoalteromonas denitrificans DSM 6059 TaxID=1123010 RepID=A0A1I1PDE4_9GAMM|nr:GIY-YIG nuclease family protein [Pseudoalteromonas denitrificans]SFD05638.1 T5orf172 domain-containing protein [Pseudoalteromonas denitrificans DSM 6059]